MSLIIPRNFKRANALDAAARDRTPDGWWEGKTIFAAFGWGKSVKGKVVSHKGGVIKLADGTTFKESDAYDLYAIDSSASDSADKTEKIAKDSAIVALFQPLADAQAELRDGNKKSNAKNVLAAAISAAEKEFKENPFSSRDKRIIDDAKKVLAQFDAAAQDAKFKIGQKVKYTGRTPLIGGRTGPVVGTIKFVDTQVFADGYPLYEVEFPGSRLTDTIGEEHLRAADGKDSISDKEREYTRLYST